MSGRENNLPDINKEMNVVESMARKEIEKAREYEEKKKNEISEKDRPLYHVTGGVGWINDPNGFSVYQGEYHLFYQYHPYTTHWGPMHWGHVKTKDFVKWERLPIAIAPDTPEDEAGCFSGSAIELEDGRQLILYTGVSKKKMDDGEEVCYQQQCVAIGDGINYEKSNLNPVISSEMLPEGASKLDFRDPKIWKDEKGFHCVVANRTEDGSGAILMYQSEDGLHWNYEGEIDRSRNEYGKMWECPDFYELDGKYVLAVSPQEVQPKDLEFHAGNCTAFFVGNLDAQKKFCREYVQAIDYGIDFYAPQSLQAEDGRRIIIAWMQNWETSNVQEGACKFFGEMTFPRELSIRNGRVCQNPVREIERYYGEKVSYENQRVFEETSLAGISGRVLDMTVVLHNPEDTPLDWFEIQIAKDENWETKIRYEASTETILLDRTRCSCPVDVVHIRRFRVDGKRKQITFRLLLDKHSVELFVNEGEQAATLKLYTPQSADGICFMASHEVQISVEKQELRF